jgi:hypothetical protein
MRENTHYYGEERIFCDVETLLKINAFTFTATEDT